MTNRNRTVQQIREARARKAANNAKLAAEDFRHHADNVESLLAEIKAALKTRRAETTKPNYGHVGDMRHYEQQLANIADSLLGRGEYA